MSESVSNESGISDLRNSVSEAWTKLESQSEAPAVKADAPAAPAPVEAPAKPEAASEGPVRDEKGRFAKDAGAASKGNEAPRAPVSGTQEAAAEAPGPPAAAAPAAPPAPVLELKAPQSWKPSAREAFAKAPPEVQAEALRREAEISKALNETAEPRKNYQAFKDATAPYEHVFRAAGVSAPQAVGNLLRTYEQLGTAPQHVRAGILANLVKTHLGTDEAAINALAQAIDGKGVFPTPQPYDPRQIDQLLDARIRAREEQAQLQGITALEEQFRASKPEFLDQHLEPDMRLVLGQWRAANPDAPVTIDIFQQAYDKACRINDDVAKALAQREAAKAAANANASTQKAKSVSSSVKSQPGGPAQPPELGDDTRSHMAAAWDRVAGQR